MDGGSSKPRQQEMFGGPPEAKPARSKAAKQGRDKGGSKGQSRGRGKSGSASRRAKPLAQREIAGYAQVVLDRPVRREFTYAIPMDLAHEAQPSREAPPDTGQEASVESVSAPERTPSERTSKVQPGIRVAVPFGARREVGVVVSTSNSTDIDARRVRPIAKLLDSEPLLDPELIELTRWVASRYACSHGEAVHAVLPSALKREREGQRVWMAAVGENIGELELKELVDRQPKQHRLLRTLMDINAPVELRDLCRRLNVTDSPARTLAKRGWVKLWRAPASPDPLSQGAPSKREKPSQLSPDQAKALETIHQAMDAGHSGGFLLEGVTGSGKTEVYLRAIERSLDAGRGAIVLVPEIALTPQTVDWFRSRFGRVAVLHSRMTDVQRLDMWMEVRRGEAKVVVGARSAVFAPVPNLGVIAVDEEHEPSFKQGSAPRYHAREVALRRAKLEGAICLLGSATPSLESYRRARSGELQHLELLSRVAERPLPKVEIVDMRSEQYQIGRDGLFSRRLKHLIETALEKKEQSILFLNRRGFSPVLWCPSCKVTLRCTTCDVSLTFHRRIGRMVCHSCCEEQAPPKACPGCSFPGLRYLGAGSERIDAALRETFPDARVCRMDSDTMRRREDYEESLDAFGRGETDLLVGTQMIAKGLDFPRVTVVGIINADSALHLPDFRAAERTFQLLAQVAGRAGRGELEGRIVVQTTSPEHPAIQFASKHDYRGFAANEMELRSELGYPPHGRLIRVLCEDNEHERAVGQAEQMATRLMEEFGMEGVMVLGPAPAPFAQLRGRFREHLLVKLPEREGTPLDLMLRVRNKIVDLAEGINRPRIAIDVDPVDML